MSLSLFSILVPFQLEAMSEGVSAGKVNRGLVEVDSIANEQASAIVTAQNLVRAWSAMRYPGQKINFTGPPTCAGNAKAFDGPFGYVFSRSNHISHLPFPKRLNGDPSEKLGQLLGGLNENEVYAVIIDCTHLAHINSVGLTSIAAHVKRLRLHLYQVKDSVRKVIEVVGLAPLIHIHADLKSALAGAAAEVAKRKNT